MNEGIHRELSVRDLLLGFVGDIHINRPEPVAAFSAVKSIIGDIEVMFGNLEGSYTERSEHHDSVRKLCAPKRMLRAFSEVGFDVMSLANNHVLDAGPDDMLETREILRASGVRTCGAGRSLLDARTPAVIDTGQAKIAYLAYACHFPIGYEAEADRPGLAPVRVYDVWQPAWPGMRPYYAPGQAPYITSNLDISDLSHLATDIAHTRKVADVIVVSFHWGDMTRQFHITDHESRIAHHSIDQGAHLVVGHHHHALRGMEWYKGRPIMYGLGHFVFDVRWDWSASEASEFLNSSAGRYFRQMDYAGGPKRGWPYHAFPQEYRMTAIAWAKVDHSRIDQIGFLPCALSSDGSVHPLRVESAMGKRVIRYMRQCIKSQGLNAIVVPDDTVSFAGFTSVRVIPQRQNVNEPIK